MVNPLIPFLREVVSRIQPFANNVTHIHMKNQDDGTVIAIATAINGGLQFSATSLIPIDLGGSRLCMGNIPFLHMTLNSHLLDASTEIILHDRNSRNDKPIVGSIEFKAPNGVNINYMASDPFRQSLMKPQMVNIEEWPVVFDVPEALVRQLSEMKKIHATAPSGGGKDILQVVYGGDKNIHFEFGSESHVSTINPDIEIETEFRRKFTVQITTNEFLLGLDQALKLQMDEPVITAFMEENAIQIISESNLAEHTMTLSRMKVDV